MRCFGRCGRCAARRGGCGLEGHAASCARLGAGILHAVGGVAGIACCAAGKHAEQEHGSHHQQQDEHQGGHLFTQPQMREQCGQTQTGGQAGERAHPRALAGVWRGGLLAVGALLRSGGRLALGRRRGLALHAEAAATAQAFLGFGVGDDPRQSENGQEEAQEQMLHRGYNSSGR